MQEPRANPELTGPQTAALLTEHYRVLAQMQKEKRSGQGLNPTAIREKLAAYSGKTDPESTQQLTHAVGEMIQYAAGAMDGDKSNAVTPTDLENLAAAAAADGVDLTDMDQAAEYFQKDDIFARIMQRPALSQIPADKNPSDFGYPKVGAQVNGDVSSDRAS